MTRVDTAWLLHETRFVQGPMRFLTAFIASLVLTCSVAHADFPEKTLRIMVYTAPGGLIDRTARVAADIMQKDLVHVPVIVENKKGAGGLVALHYLSQKPADGYTLFGLTSSVISIAVTGRQQKLLEDLDILAIMARDYECLITRIGAEIESFEDIRQHPDRIWLGPAAGGTDHLFALRVWKTLGAPARWIPYRSGGTAVAALLGGHGDIYVGNPGDLKGRTELTIAAVASPTRLPAFPNAPTFEELGWPALSGEVLWRGFAVRKDTPVGVKERIIKLLHRVSSSKRWTDFLEESAVQPVFETGAAVHQAVSQQIIADTDTFREASKLR